ESCPRGAGSRAWAAGGRGASGHPRSRPSCHHRSGPCVPCSPWSPSCRGPSPDRVPHACAASSRRAPAPTRQVSWSTLTMCCTAKTMPRIVSVSSCTTVWLMRRRPRAFTVASCLGLSPMIDLVRVSLSFLLDTAGVLREVPVTAPARRVQILKPLDPAQGVHGGLEHVVGIVGAEGLGQDVLDSGRLQDGTHGAPGN